MMKGWLVRGLVTAIGVSLRYRIEDPHRVLEIAPQTPLIFVFWHNRIFLMPHLFRRFWHRQGRTRAAVLVSRSKDGQLLTEILSAFDLRCVRGSSSRGGQEALREMTKLVGDGFDIGITPDGPRGPRYILQPGCLSLAQLTGAQIIPVSYDLSRKLIFKSWDAFMVPWPFTRCTVRLGDAFTVARDADETTAEAQRAALENALRALSGDLV